MPPARPACRVRAPAWRTAAGAGDAGQVTAPWHLDQYRARPQRVPGGAQRQGRQPRRGGGLVPAELGGVGGRPDPRCGGAQRRPVGSELMRPARPAPAASSPPSCANPPIRAAAPARCARSASTSRACGYGALGSACRSSPSSHRTTRPRSADRGEHRRPGARHDQGLAAQRREPAPVPLRGAEVGGERDVQGGCRTGGRLGGEPRLPGQLSQCGVDAGQVAGVGNDDDRAAARARGGEGGAGDLVGPAGPRQRRPGRAGRAAAGERVEE